MVLHPFNVLHIPNNVLITSDMSMIALILENLQNILQNFEQFTTKIKLSTLQLEQLLTNTTTQIKFSNSKSTVMTKSKTKVSKKLKK